jgi:hypothetical protein
VPDPDATEAQLMRYRHWLKLDEDR